MSLDVDDLISKLIEERGSKNYRCPTSPPEMELRQLALAARERFMAQPMLLEVKAPIRIVGDIHGQFQDLLRWFELLGYPPESKYLFLGNYVDYGEASIETICLLLAFTLKYPETFFLLRGSHECASINRIHGFFDECKRRYSIRLFKVFTDVFDCLPVAAVVENAIFCCHGGLSPDLHSVDQIRQIARPTDVPNRGLLCDLLWADPEEGMKGWTPIDYGVSYMFGEDVVDDFLDKSGLDLICRAHRVMEKGYGFFAQRQLVTIFSAPNYCGEFDNAGGVMSVAENCLCSFNILPANTAPAVSE